MKCKNVQERRKGKPRMKDASTPKECRCKIPRKSKSKYKRNLREHGTSRGPTNLGRNPYLNYFRQFYSKRGGRVVEAAKAAGANWRKMSPEEKAKYKPSNSRKHQRSTYSRVRKLNRIFRLLTPKSSKTGIKRENIVRVRRILERWTRQIYKEISAECRSE